MTSLSIVYDANAFKKPTTKIDVYVIIWYFFSPFNALPKLWYQFNLTISHSETCIWLNVITVQVHNYHTFFIDLREIPMR